MPVNMCDFIDLPHKAQCGERHFRLRYVADVLSV